MIGPPGTRRVVDGILAMLALDQGYRRAHHADLRHRMAVTVTEVDPAAVLAIDGARITVRATDHRPVAPGDEDNWRKLAAAHVSGEIVIGGDLTAVSVGQHATGRG